MFLTARPKNDDRKLGVTNLSLGPLKMNRPATTSQLARRDEVSEK
jgi:hypothetical protein